MGLPATNAVLTKIAGGGFSEDFDQGDATENVKWLGSEDAYLVEKVASSVTGQGLEQARIDYLILPYSVAQPITVGDIVTYAQGAAPVSRKVRTIETHKIAGTTRLYLWDVKA